MRKVFERKLFVSGVLTGFCLAVFFGAACDQNSAVNNTVLTVSNSNGSTANVNINSAVGNSTTANIDGTPAAVIRDYHNAAVKKDTEGMKKAVSKNALVWFEQQAKKNKVSLDEYLKNIANGTEDNKAEFVNKSSNDKSALVCLQSNGQTSILPSRLVKENGDWKFEAQKTYEYLDLIDEARGSADDNKKSQAFQKAMKILGKDYCP